MHASNVAISNCILVTNIGDNVTDDTLRYYFENPRRAGGGSVEKLDFTEGRDIALVYFMDYKGWLQQ